jgi:hypothetical protein
MAGELARPLRQGGREEDGAPSALLEPRGRVRCAALCAEQNRRGRTALGTAEGRDARAGEGLARRERRAGSGGQVRAQAPRRTGDRRGGQAARRRVPEARTQGRHQQHPGERLRGGLLRHPQPAGGATGDGRQGGRHRGYQCIGGRVGRRVQGQHEPCARSARDGAAGREGRDPRRPRTGWKAAHGRRELHPRSERLGAGDQPGDHRGAERRRQHRHGDRRRDQGHREAHGGSQRPVLQGPGDREERPQGHRDGATAFQTQYRQEFIAGFEQHAVAAARHRHDRSGDQGQHRRVPRRRLRRRDRSHPRRQRPHPGARGQPHAEHLHAAGMARPRAQDRLQHLREPGQPARHHADDVDGGAQPQDRRPDHHRAEHRHGDGRRDRHDPERVALPERSREAAERRACRGTATSRCSASRRSWPTSSRRRSSRTRSTSTCALRRQQPELARQADGLPLEERAHHRAPEPPGQGTSAREELHVPQDRDRPGRDTEGLETPVGYNEEQDYSWARASMYMGAKLLQNSGVVVITADGSAYA